MFNVGSGEFLIILLVALVVLGPTRLPGALRQVGQFLGEARKLSSNFQNEVQEAMKDPVKVVTGEDTPKLPKSGKEMLGFAVPEPFAAQKAEPSETDRDLADSDSTEDADGPDSVAEAEALPSKTGPTFHSAGPATPIAVDAEEPEESSEEESVSFEDELPDESRAESPVDGGNPGGSDESDDEVPMFGDR